MHFLNEARRATSEHFAKPVDQRAVAEAVFHRMILLERRRAVRSGKSFLIMLLELSEAHRRAEKHEGLTDLVLSTLLPITRETDVTGWYREAAVVGVMFTEITSEDLTSVTAKIMDRYSRALRQSLTPRQFEDIGISFHSLPESPEQKFAPHTEHPMVYPGVTASVL